MERPFFDRIFMQVLIVDDSLIYRSHIKRALENHPHIQVADTATDGRAALDILKSGKEIDLVTLDLEMPNMGGIDLLKAMRAEGIKKKVIVFSSKSKRGSEETFAALREGATDFVTKPSGDELSLSSATEKIESQLIPKIMQFIDPRLAANKKSLKTSSIVKKSLYTFNPDLIVIGSSTGGPGALEKIFENFKGDLRIPICIAQHMPPFFTETLAKGIARQTGLECTEAEDGKFLEPGRIYIAPGDYHMYLRNAGGKVVIRTDQAARRNSVRPAVDHLFETACDIYGPKLMAFILTGMGDDGLLGCKKIKEAGGGVMIQSKESCVVFGMPGAVFEAELYDEIGDLAAIHNLMKRMALS